MKRLTGLLAASLLLLAGCEEEQIIQSKPRPRQPAAGAAGAAGTAAIPPRVPIDESDFVENDKSRDPFRSYASLFAGELQVTTPSQLEIVLPEYSIDELKLIGIVTRVQPARAMVVDPNGKGHVIRRGQFIGRPDVMRRDGNASASYQVNWRVDRIREGDVVLIREDPTNPDVPAVSRVLPLRTEAEASLD